MQFSASASSHTCAHANKDRTQTYRRHRTARSRWFMLTERLSSLLLSPPCVAAAGKGGEGKRCELDGQRGCQFNVDGDVSRFSWPCLSLVLLVQFQPDTPRVPSPPLDCRLTPSRPSPAACWLEVLTAAPLRPHFDPAL